MGNDYGISDKYICNFKTVTNCYRYSEQAFGSANYPKPFSCAFGFTITQNTLCQV